MGSGQYKRIYNIVFVLMAVSTCVFVHGISKKFISSMIENAKEDYQQQLNHLTPFQDHHDDLVKQGKTKEAQEVLDDADRRYFRRKAVGDRIEFCEQHLGMLSVIPTILAYIGIYFLVWYSICFCVRYVKAGQK